MYEKLNAMQREAVFATEGPVLILAGAGSGKTRVLTYRTAYLIEEKQVNPYHIMAITFTNKAAEEMRQRINNLIGYGAESVWVSTFHSVCARILRRYGECLGYDKKFTIYDADDQKQLVKGICKRLKVDTKIYKERSCLNVISDAKNNLITPEAFTMKAGNDLNLKKYASVYTEYQKELKKNNVMDFDDLLMKTVQLFQEFPEVLEIQQDRFRYIMVDEYQDTNTAQFMFVKLLASKYKNLCVVGDDDQSIYRFRGADIKNILSFENVYPDAKVIKLEQNYRSTQRILDAANSVIKNNKGRKEKALWTENEGGNKIEFKQFDTSIEEAEFIKNQIQEQVKNGKTKYNDYAILYRTNAQSRLFEEQFVKGNVPYKIIGGINFYARKEIKDLLSYLKTVDSARDDLAVRRIINVPKRGIGATTIGRVQEYAQEKEISFYHALKLADEIQNIGKGGTKVRSFVMFIQAMRSKLEVLSISELLKDIIEETGYVAELEAENTEESRARIENIDELISKAVTYEESVENPTLSEFLEEVALVADIDNWEEESNYVVLMTLHSAKGLEFPCVYLSGMEDGVFPSYMSISSGNMEDIEEERRLCYVGITRAMQKLIITCARQRMIRGEMQYNRMSRFVKEIPKEVFSENVKSFPIEEKKYQAYAQARENFYSKPFQSIIPPKKSNSFGSKAGKFSELPYKAGDRVHHAKFGDGVVQQIVAGGRDYEVTVEFDDVGVKKMFAGFAKLEKR